MTAAFQEGIVGAIHEDDKLSAPILHRALIAPRECLEKDDGVVSRELASMEHCIASVWCIQVVRTVLCEGGLWYGSACSLARKCSVKFLLADVKHGRPPLPDSLGSVHLQAPRTAIEDVRQVIREELGEYPEAIWKSFEPEPIASASLAQVHRAVGWDGQELAIKVLRSTRRAV